MECTCASSNVSNIHLQKKQQTEDKTRSAMLALDVLDCPICVEPFNIPIFQCDNGHLACASCCPKLNNKCPACALPIGHNRCRAMESVLESIFIPCTNAKLGCTKNITYGKESTHEKECSFSLICSCPIQDCKYTGSYKHLYYHYTLFTHRSLSETMMNSFTCGDSFDVQMNISDKMKILLEYEKILLFVVQCFREPYGVYVTVSCIAPSTPEVGEFSCHLSYTMDGNTITYEVSEVKRIRQVSFQRPEGSFMLIPNSLLRGEMLEMELCIKQLYVEPRVRSYWGDI